MTSTAYYSDGSVTLYHGDCRTVLPDLGLTADCVVADPPYGETSLAWDRWPDGWVQAVSAVLPSSASLWCFGSARMFLAHVADFEGWSYGQEALWLKRNGSGPGSRDRLLRVHEWAYHWYRGRWTDLHHEWERQPSSGSSRGSARRAAAAVHQRRRRETTWHDDGLRQPRSARVLEAGSVRYEKRHPDEKPLSVVTELVRECAPTGALVLDPFAGSGSTLVAARDSGRRAVGIEADERYCQVIVRRLAQDCLPVAAE